MTVSALIALFLITLAATPVAALAVMLWNSIGQAGFGDVFPDERLLAAITNPQRGDPPLWS